MPVSSASRSSTPLFSPADRRIAAATAELIYCNPFLPRRIELEREALGDLFDEEGALWNIRAAEQTAHPNVARLVVLAEGVLDRAQPRLASGGCSDRDVELYQSLVLFVLFDRWQHLVGRHLAEDSASTRAEACARLAQQAESYLAVGDRRLDLLERFPHTLACFFQLSRAFHNISNYIVGISKSAAELRAAVWQSIFTFDMRRYGRLLYRHMADYTTLIIGPSGTGKELAARAIGLSRYVPLDRATATFTADIVGSFFPLNLSALSPTLIESELFGHKRGSFTGAVADRSGWLEVCPELGTVFLDEIGELDPAVQVKMLRVLENRTFSRLGESKTRRFSGKVIASTNRDLSLEISKGTFREDFYYRLCSDVIVMPSLRQRLDDDPRELSHLVLHLTRQLVDEEAADVGQEVLAWIEHHLPADYPWPGNVRELEQCVRNVLIRNSYTPPGTPNSGCGSPWLEAQLSESDLTADQLLRHYCTLVYVETGSYKATAARLQIDRRTVRAKIDDELVAVLRGNRQPACVEFPLRVSGKRRPR